MKTNTRNVFVGVILMIVMLFGISMLTACNDVTLDKLQNEFGIVIDGGGFEEGSTLISNQIAASTEEATEVLAAIADQNYNKDGSVYIFDIYVTKDGAKVQPSGKVKVSVPLPNIQVDNYLVFHVKADNSVENLVPTVADGKISFETSSFSYFIIAEAAPDEHVHDYVWIEGTEPTCEKEGVIAHYHCDGCGKNSDPNYGEVETVSIPKAEHEYGSMYWGKSANFWEDGNIEYYQCAVCEKYFDAEYNEVETVVIPKYSTNLSICVNGTPTALVLGEQHENFIEWSLEGLSVTKGDVIMDETMELAANSSGDGKRFQQEIRSLSEQMVVIREQLEMAKERIASNEKINSEIENIKEYLSSSDICFTEYSDVTVRRLVEYIRVMKDNSIIIVLKGGIQIREPIETNN